MNIDNNNLEKNNKTFVDEILNELSELDFSKIKNLMVVCLGILSPLVPLIFLYRRDLLKELELIGVLILALTINSILIMFNTIIYKLKERKDIELLLMKTETMVEKDRDIISCFELLNKFYDKKILIKCLEKDFSCIDDLKENNELIEQLEKVRDILLIKDGIIINEEEIYIQGNNSKKILEENIKKINKRLEGIKNKKVYENESFEMAFLVNIVIGLIIIILKVVSYLNIYSMSLKGILIVIIMGYCGGIFSLINANLKLKYTEFKLKRIRKR